MTEIEALLALEPRELGDLLTDLATRTQRSMQGQPLRRPFVTLRLRNGTTAPGFVLACKESRGGQQVLLHHVLGETRVPTYDVIWLPLATIEAVEVHNAALLDSPPADAKPPPSPVELKRDAAAFQTRLETLFGTPLAIALPDPLPPEAIEPLADLLTRVKTAFGDVAANQTSRASVVAKIKRVVLQVGASAGVTLAGDALTVITTRKPLDRQTTQAMTQAIEAQL